MEYYLITGTNRGIGLELTKQLLQKGVTVIACCRNPEQASELNALLLKGNKERLIIFKLEITNEKDIQALSSFLEDRGIKLNVLVLNAGIAEPAEQIGTITQQQLLDVLNTNTVGPLLVIQALVDHFDSRKAPAKIICISSDLGSISRASDLVFGLSYGVSKAALNMGVKKLSGELLKRGITINAMHPGWVKTDMGGSGAPLTTTQSVTAMLEVIDGLQSKTGLFLNYRGQEVAW
ncbi:MAG: SDR family oxidoreductase [Bacteroidetes bacterium]|nr:SDR family oxidoreductase [Bacteroidota bacterium]